MTKNRSFSGGISERYALALLELSNEANKTDEYVSILSSFMTIYNSDKSNVVTQSAFFNQCLKDGNLFPINDKFSKVVSIPGSYLIVADIVSTDLSNISTTGTFTVK